MRRCVRRRTRHDSDGLPSVGNVVVCASRHTLSGRCSSPPPLHRPHSSRPRSGASPRRAPVIHTISRLALLGLLTSAGFAQGDPRPGVSEHLSVSAAAPLAAPVDPSLPADARQLDPARAELRAVDLAPASLGRTDEILRRDVRSAWPLSIRRTAKARGAASADAADTTTDVALVSVAAEGVAQNGEETPAEPGPEPASMLLVGAGLIALAMSSRRWRRTLSSR